MLKVLVPSPQTSDETTLAIALDVVNGLTGNTYFPDISPTLAALTAAKDAYAVAMGAARYGSREDKALKNEKKLQLLNILRTQAAYINMEAQDDVVKLSSTGFKLSKTPASSVLGIAQPKADYGTNPGEMILYTPTVPGAVTYKHQYTNDPEHKEWKEELTTAAKCKIVNMAAGQTYFMRIVSVGTSSQTTISEMITKMAV